ncbi:MAG: magnesium and cobalt transport protein CorA [Burkholderiaceae bacterium]|jgi:magnesium transporter|nr:magnesium and cobalt transport protein CorA [Burkholderiaceae bacterium]NCU79577.1 magnesium and cobalt transport protein CorA [Burkholderiaceae bacterium]NCY00565.1 magnesium and cobalt transport protein CorA [Burkholderiaceae bacterium]NDB23147.1 magnesium and cobalt transport protein CorA [Burkholderiaceae bacterium]NDC04778.1 magnesium and cobalt transport protein CorA [Burkholderiaceae bacterium]
MLINCASYQNGKKIADIDIENISDHIADKNSFVWVALLDPTVDEIAKMKEEFDLHPLAVEDALLGHQRPKIEEYGKSLFAVIQVLKYDDDISVGELDIFAASDYVLSIRNRSDVGFLGVRQRCEQEPELLSQGSGFVLYALIDAVVDRYFPIVERLELELENIEETLFDERSTKSNIERLFELKRKVMVVKHAVSPLMEAVGKLSSGRVPPICANSTEYFRDILDHLTRINSVIESIRDAIGTAIQVSLSAIALEQNNIQKRLASWAAIFAVATAFAGIWGMNFEQMPELKWDLGYPIAISIIVLACSFLYWRFKRSGWL